MAAIGDNLNVHSVNHVCSFNNTGIAVCVLAVNGAAAGIEVSYKLITPVVSLHDLIVFGIGVTDSYDNIVVDASSCKFL